jgi:hypothetical protein
MRRQSLFWGSILILLAALFLLKASGVTIGGKELDVWGYFWALGMMLVGIWFVASVYLPKDKSEDIQGANVALQGAKEARVEFHHGAGQVVIESGAPADMLLVSNKGTGMSISSEMDGDILKVKADLGPTLFPFVGPESGTWNVHLNSDIPMAISMEAGASQIALNLADLKVTRLKLETGASSTKLNLPAGMKNTLVDIEAGAASVDIAVPSGTAARIRVKEGVSSLQIDKDRFQWIDNTLYQSADYENATNRVDLTIETGVGSISIH